MAIVSKDDLQKNKDCFCSERRLKGRSGVDASDVQDNHPCNHVNDSSSDDKGINGQEDRIEYRLGFGRRLWKKKVEDGFAE